MKVSWFMYFKTTAFLIYFDFRCFLWALALRSSLPSGCGKVCFANSSTLFYSRAQLRWGDTEKVKLYFSSFWVHFWVKWFFTIWAFGSEEIPKSQISRYKFSRARMTCYLLGQHDFTYLKSYSGYGRSQPAWNEFVIISVWFLASPAVSDNLGTFLFLSP